MIITVVRHLEPISPREGVVDVDRPLAYAGNRSAERLLRNVTEGVGVYDIGYTSPYARCRSTAAHLNSAVADNRGWYETAELRESAHPGQEVFVRTKALTLPESMFNLRDRIARFLDMVNVPDPAAKILVVTHGDVVNAFRWCIEGLTLDEFRGLHSQSVNMVDIGSAWTFDTRKGELRRTRLYGDYPDLVKTFREVRYPRDFRVTKAGLP